MREGLKRLWVKLRLLTRTKCQGYALSFWKVKVYLVDQASLKLDRAWIWCHLMLMLALWPKCKHVNARKHLGLVASAKTRTSTRVKVA